MNIHATLALLSICVIAVPSFAEAKTCRKHRPITRLKYEVEPTQYIRDLSANELTAWHSGGGPSTVLGLAGGEVGTRFETSFETKPVGNNLYCLNVKRINAVLFVRPQVHIARNFKRGTCEYNAVLRHEDKHVRVLKQAHTEYLPKYQHHLRTTSKKIPKLPPMTLAQANQERHALVEQIKRNLSSYLEVIMSDVARRQQKVDTAEEYQRVAERCRKWEKRLNSE